MESRNATSHVGNMVAKPESQKLGKYTINHYRTNPENVVVVFSSAGIDGLGEPIEEFKTSLSKFDCSLIFVIDNSPKWYNHPQSAELLSLVAGLSNEYKNIAALGESMGASGAILFSEYCPKLGRILALSPQYSVALPFIAFDARFRKFGEVNPEQTFWSFAPSSAISKTCLLFGDRDALDSVHAGMYVLEGFSVYFVKGAGHLVAKQLKKGSAENRLAVLLDRFLDFSLPFDASAVNRVLGELAAPRPIDPDFSFAADQQRRASIARNRGQSWHLPPPKDAVNISHGCPTNQSSICRWSNADTPAKDSANAVAEDFRRTFAFHTDKEPCPWWSIDLMQEREIQELRIYNRIENTTSASRGLNFVIEVSNGDKTWREVFRKEDSVMFGGADGKPFIWRPEEAFSARHLRIRLLETNFLHYQRIEIFGPAAQ